MDEKAEFDAEEAHSFDAYTSLLLNGILIFCILLSYYIKVKRLYFLPESAAAMIIGVVIGGFARLFVNDLQLFSFSPELFFFIYLPPIIFEAGYSLNQKLFFENIGAIFLYAMFGTMISCFLVGYLLIYASKAGIITSIDSNNHMEPLLFGALISAVDPVATLSIMGSPELECDELLYSLVFGESVLNDAVAIVLFKTFRAYYNPDQPDFTHSDIPKALVAFVFVTILSVLVGAALGLLTSFIFKHTQLSQYAKFETALLFLFCYLCYASAEALELSGIMALFFNGIILKHYNSYNLSEQAQITSEHIFATVATIMETVVFLYMGMGVFTSEFGSNWDISFSVLAFTFCLIGRAINIFPLSWLANRCRSTGRNRISFKMQCVLWFVGLRGAIAFALSENMPGPNKDTYATATLSICMFTTVVCGGFTEKVLSLSEMKQPQHSVRGDDNDDGYVYDNLSLIAPIAKVSKTAWSKFDDLYLIPLFGGLSNSDDCESVEISGFELNERDHSK